MTVLGKITLTKTFQAHSNRMKSILHLLAQNKIIDPNANKYKLTWLMDLEKLQVTMPEKLCASPKILLLKFVLKISRQCLSLVTVVLECSCVMVL
jgi:hypothetical protein